MRIVFDTGAFIALERRQKTALEVVRIAAEDRVLSQDTRWTTYAATVRYRLIPGLW